MSGGGASILGRHDPEKLRERLRREEDRAKTDAFETEVAGLIGDVLAQYNARDVGGIREILDRLSTELGKEVEGAIELLFGGSVAKHTYVDGLSDIDALVLLERGSTTGDSPEALRWSFAQRLRAAFGPDAVGEGTLAVTLTLGEKSIQLLPAVRVGEDFKIASSDGRTWSPIRPRTFAESLTKENARMSGKLVPTVKLAKGIIASLPEPRRLTGYHVEALALRVFEKYDGAKTPKAMLSHFFTRAPELVRRPIRDSTGQSIFVDDYLGDAGSERRGMVADALHRILSRMRNADGAQSLPRWRELLGNL